MGNTKTKTSSKLRENILKIMVDGKQRNIDQIKEALEECGMILNQDYNTNHLSGALKRLKTQKILNCCGRGIYQRDMSKNTAVDFAYEDLSWIIEPEPEITKNSCLVLNQEADEELQKIFDRINIKLKAISGLDIAKMKENEREAFEKLSEKTNIIGKLLGA